MTEVYKGKPDDRVYTGEKIDVTYNLKRCIHARECVLGAPDVFDVNKRPWISPDGDDADKLASVIERCPSGALHYTRKDEGAQEAIPDENRVILWQDGPYQVTADMLIQAAGVDIPTETRVTLCRCGASENKPFCDNSHKKIDFTTDDRAAKEAIEQEATGGKLSLTALPAGPLQVEGNFRIEDADGNPIHAGTRTALCRCGASSSKPFCDGTHNTIGFDAE